MSSHQSAFLSHMSAFLSQQGVFACRHWPLPATAAATAPGPTSIRLTPSQVSIIQVCSLLPPTHINALRVCQRFLWWRWHVKPSFCKLFCSGHEPLRLHSMTAACMCTDHAEYGGCALGSSSRANSWGANRIPVPVVCVPYVRACGLSLIL